MLCQARQLESRAVSVGVGELNLVLLVPSTVLPVQLCSISREQALECFFQSVIWLSLQQSSSPKTIMSDLRGHFWGTVLIEFIQFITPRIWVQPCRRQKSSYLFSGFITQYIFINIYDTAGFKCRLKKKRKMLGFLLFPGYISKLDSHINYWSESKIKVLIYCCSLRQCIIAKSNLMK